MCLIISLLLFCNEAFIIFCQNQNIFNIIINEYKSNEKYETSLIINDEIQKIFNTKEESFYIPLYISIIDLTNINRLNISNDRQTYLNNYNNLLGVSDRVIYNPKNKEKNNYKNKTMKIMLNGTMIIKNNSNLDEMIIKRIIFEKDKYNIDLYFLKNRYMSQYQNINIDNQNLFKFYDLNIIFFNDSNYLYRGIENNNLVILEKIEKELNEEKIIEIINRFINDIINDSMPNKLKIKIDLWLKIKDIFNDLLKLEHCNINLHNFLLSYEILEIKKKIRNIEKNLLPLLFYDRNKDKNFIDFNNSINDLKEFLKKYNVSQNDYKIDLYFFIVTLIMIILIVILSYKIYTEFKKAFYKKIK
jgi:hypothetical protein